MAKLKAAVIGCGGISRAHINAWLADERAEVAYCVDIDEERAREKAEVLGCKWHTDYTAILDEVDAVDVCTPPHLHADMTVEAAQRGKHVLCEKIMARNLDEAEAMIRETDKAGVVFMIAFVLRYRPEFQKLHEVCTSGVLGRILQVYEQTSMRLGKVVEWRKNPLHFPMGCFLSHGCHYVDQLIWNIGPIAEAYSMSSNYVLGDQILGDDTTVACFRHENGALSSYVESWAITRPITRIRFDAYGTQGSVRLEYHLDGLRTVELTTEDGCERVFELDPSKKDHMDPFGGAKDMHGQIAHFVDCIVDGKRPLTHGREGIKAMQVILAACEAEHSGRAVRMEDFLGRRPDL